MIKRLLWMIKRLICWILGHKGRKFWLENGWPRWIEDYDKDGYLLCLRCGKRLELVFKDGIKDDDLVG